MTFAIEIDRSRCMGSGNCAYWAPATFDVADDGVAVLIGDPSKEAERVRLAVEECPTKALRTVAPPC
jgi:ferredoxin